MEKYPKIVTVFERDPATKYKKLLDGKFAKPEFAYLAHNRWVFTEKIDGTNVRVLWTPGEWLSLQYKGRTDKSQLPVSLYNVLRQMLPFDKFHCIYPDTPMCLYGEGYGKGIQKDGDKYIHDGVSFILFDVWIGGYWLERENVEDIACQLGIRVVPIVGYGTLWQAVSLVRDGFPSQVGDRLAEGLVMRPATELQNRHGERIITKVKHRDF